MQKKGRHYRGSQNALAAAVVSAISYPLDIGGSVTMSKNNLPPKKAWIRAEGTIDNETGHCLENVPLAGSKGRGHLVRSTAGGEPMFATEVELKLFANSIAKQFGGQLPFKQDVTA